MNIREALAHYYAAERKHAKAPRDDAELNERLYAELSAAEDNLITTPVRTLDEVEAKLCFICAQLEKENDIVATQAVILLRADVRRMLPVSQRDLEAA